jgi:hypothetical protein
MVGRSYEHIDVHAFRYVYIGWPDVEGICTQTTQSGVPFMHMRITCCQNLALIEDVDHNVKFALPCMLKEANPICNFSHGKLSSTINVQDNLQLAPHIGILEQMRGCILFSPCLAYEIGGLVEHPWHATQVMTRSCCSSHPDCRYLIRPPT